MKLLEWGSFFVEKANDVYQTLNRENYEWALAYYCQQSSQVAPTIHTISLGAAFLNVLDARDAHSLTILKYTICLNIALRVTTDIASVADRRGREHSASEIQRQKQETLTSTQLVEKLHARIRALIGTVNALSSDGNPHSTVVVQRRN